MLKCPECGGSLRLNANGIYECEYCGMTYAANVVEATGRKASNGTEMLAMANRNLEAGYYEEAYYAFSGCLESDPKNPAAYWGRVLSRYGVLYETTTENGITFSKPTINRMDTRSILENEDYRKALQYASKAQADRYRTEAGKIDRIQKRYMDIASSEKPYDVFISFKAQEDATGESTEDSSIAYEIYERLRAVGNLNVFFSRITLQEKQAGTEYEPYIYSALNTAKTMILVGTTPEHLQAVWVRNEWRRFLVRMHQDPTRAIIPVLKGMTASDLPKEIPSFNAITYKGRESLAEITEGVLNLTGKGTVLEEDETEKAISALTEELKNACRSKNFKAVRRIANEILDLDAENGEAYYYLLLAEYGVSKNTELADIDKDWMSSPNYKRALQFAGETLRARLEAAKERCEFRKEEAGKAAFEKAENTRKKKEIQENIDHARRLISEYNYIGAQKVLTRGGYRDDSAEELLHICSLGIEADQHIGSGKDYYDRTLQKKDPAFFKKYEEAMKKGETAPPAEDEEEEYKRCMIGSLVGVILLIFSFGTAMDGGNTALVVIAAILGVAANLFGAAIYNGTLVLNFIILGFVGFAVVAMLIGLADFDFMLLVEILAFFSAIPCAITLIRNLSGWNRCKNARFKNEHRNEVLMKYRTFRKEERSRLEELYGELGPGYFKHKGLE